MKIAVDVGYATTKGVSNQSKVIFPSVTAPAGDDLLAGVVKNTMEHRVRVGRDNVQECLVGDAALMSASATGFLALREKPDGIHDLLLLTAAYLLLRNNELGLVQLEIAIGLPLAYFKSQKDELKKRLNGYSASVSVDGGRELRLFLNRVAVFPQGAGALMVAGELPDSGLVALLDIGSYTTDYMLFNIRQGQPVPVSECCGSIEAGVSLVSRERLQKIFSVRRMRRCLPGCTKQSCRRCLPGSRLFTRDARLT